MQIFINKKFDDCFGKFLENNPIKLVDVGASDGMQEKWNPLINYLTAIFFEPDKKEYDNLLISSKKSKHDFIYINKALYKNKTTLNFYVTRKQRLSGILKPNRNFIDKFYGQDKMSELRKSFWDILNIIKIKTEALDDIFKENKIDNVDFLKVDVEGTEVFILEGAKKIIDKEVFGMEIEVEFVHIHENQPLFADVDSFVRPFGFYLFDLRQSYWKRAIGKYYGYPKGQIVTADLLYLRTPESFKNMLDSIKQPEFKKLKVIKAVAICILYGYIDYAVEIFENNKNLFEEHEKNMFFNYFKTCIPFSRKIPDFPGRGIISRILYWSYSKLKPAYQGWEGGLKELGNLE